MLPRNQLHSLISSTGCPIVSINHDMDCILCLPGVLVFYKLVGEGSTEAEMVPYDPWRTVEYIRNSFASDRLAHYFTTSSGTLSESNIGEATLIDRKQDQETHFSDMVESVSSACRSMLKQPSITLSANSTVTESQTLVLESTSDDTYVGRVAASWMDDDQVELTLTRTNFPFQY